MKSVRYVALIVAAAVALTGCATTSEFVNMWKSPNWAGPALTNVLIVFASKDTLHRRGYEDAMALQLRAKGLKAVQSYTVLPDDRIDKEAIARLVKEGGYDGVIAARLSGVSQEQNYVPGYVSAVPYYGGWGGWYGGWYGAVYEPGYMTTTTIARVETQVWQVNVTEPAMIWTGMSETVDPQQTKNVAGEIAEVTIETLQKAGVLPAGK
ncbi:MAG: hypothetical protein MUF27_08440 [Acidobacteria bacterium]|jgi:hypothetical protein|nr:hypothetical protein [Acidobacteriota bacterium]